MSKTPHTPQLSKEAVALLVDTFHMQLLTACKRWGVLPGEVYGNMKVKRQPVARAREDVILWMREHVGMNASQHPTEVRIFDDVCEMRREAYPISYPTLKRCLGLDHSTCILCHQRALKRRAAGAQPLTNEPKVATVPVHSGPETALSE